MNKLTDTRGETYINGRGLYQYRTEVFAEMMTKTVAELRAIVAGVHDGIPELSKGVSKLRKADLAAMCAEWETGSRENEEACTAIVTPDVLPPVDPAVLIIEEIEREQYAGTLNAPAPDYREMPAGTDRKAAKAEHFAPGSGVLVPVFEAPRLNTIRGQRPADVVQADRDHLVQAYGEQRADEILDTWTLRENRADRRDGDRVARIRGRQSMRLRRTPSRRRFTTEAAKIRKAERRILQSVPGDRQAQAFDAAGL